jgi:hypothetical protein
MGMPSVMPANSKRKQNAPEVLKVYPRDCFVISTTRNATANPRYGFGPNSEVYLKTKNNRELMKKFLLGLSAVWRFYYRLARALKRTGSSIVKFMCTITFTTAAGIMAIGLAGSGTRVAGSNEAESNILLSKIS